MTTTTWNYQIEETEAGEFAVSEGDSPNAKGSGMYESLDAAKSAVRALGVPSSYEFEEGQNADNGLYLATISWTTQAA